MSFGRNPFVAKATAAEQKAQQAGDEAARQLAWREAARLWDRAAEREMDAKRRSAYEKNAEQARASADTPEESNGHGSDAGESDDESEQATPRGSTMMN